MFKRCILILADGARPDVLNQELIKGKLPNIARYLVDKGTQQTILTTFPSTTGPAYLPFLTGCYPGTCNVPGIRWFDREHYGKKGWSFKSFRSYVGLETLLFDHDMNPNVKTAFEIFENPISIFNNIHRGIPKGNNKTKHSRIWYYYYAHLTDHWVFIDRAAQKKVIQSLDENPDFIFVVYPAIDEYSHRSSPFNPRAIQAYHELDGYVGGIVAHLKTKGWEEDTLIVIVSDHGLSDTKTHFDVGPYLEKKGMKTFFYTQIFKKNFKAASMISGNAMAHLYFQGAKGWGEKVLFEELSHRGILLDELRYRPEVDLVGSLGADGAIHLQTSQGHGWFKIQNNVVDYSWEQGEPLDLKLGDNNHCRMSVEESLQKTWESAYPDVFVQFHQLFLSSRCGDVVLSAKTGFDLRERYEHPEHKSSHGGICPEHMRIPFLMNAPLQREMQRSVNVFPTILKLLDKKIPPGIDGVSVS